MLGQGGSPRRARLGDHRVARGATGAGVAEGGEGVAAAARKLTEGVKHATVRDRPGDCALGWPWPGVRETGASRYATWDACWPVQRAARM